MRFYLNRTGQNEGPLDEAAIVAMIQRGEVPPTAYICPEGGQSWQPLASHPPFAAPAKPAAPALPSPSPGLPQKPIAATMAMDSAMIQAAARQSQSQAGFTPSPFFGQTPTPTPQPRPPGPAGFAPPGQFGSAPGAPMMTPPAQMQGQPQPKKNNLPLMIGGGCGVLLLLAMCGICGLWALRASAQDVEDPAPACSHHCDR